MEEKEVFPFKDIVQDLWAGGSPLIDPLVPALIKVWSQVVPDPSPAVCLKRSGTPICWFPIPSSDNIYSQRNRFGKD
jgi:hypothetical protein